MLQRYEVAKSAAQHAQKAVQEREQYMPGRLEQYVCRQPKVTAYGGNTLTTCTNNLVLHSHVKASTKRKQAQQEQGQRARRRPRIAAKGGRARASRCQQSQISDRSSGGQLAGMRGRRPSTPTT